MVFEIKNKVALVTGGASGIGLEIVKELLQREAKGVVIADINTETGGQIFEELKNKFGKEKVMFVRTDVADYSSYENAFKTAIESFNNIDILVNNAGVFLDNQWEKEIDINLKGVINGVVLGLETYLKNYNQTDEAVILNTASVAALESMAATPVYSATKGGTISLTRSWGNPFHYDRCKVRVMAICPGATDTNLLEVVSDCILNETYLEPLETTLSQYMPLTQSPNHIAQESIKIIEKAGNGTIWIIEENLPAYEYILPERSIFRSNILK